MIVMTCNYYVVFVQKKCFQQSRVEFEQMKLILIWRKNLVNSLDSVHFEPYNNFNKQAYFT